MSMAKQHPQQMESSTNLVQSNLFRQLIGSHSVFDRCLRLHRAQTVRQSVTYQSSASYPTTMSVYSHMISPRQTIAEKTRKMSETMMRFCCWCIILTPNRNPTKTYAQANNDHSTACWWLEKPESHEQLVRAHHNGLTGEAHVRKYLDNKSQKTQKVTTDRT